MGNRKVYNYNKQKPVPLFKQKAALLFSYKGSSCDINKDTLYWSGKISPTPLSKEYTVVLTYKHWKSPVVWVIGNELENLDSPDFPHKYDIYPDKKMVQICLYRGIEEFNTYKYLANTIIPWTIEWLYYYELWLATGEWHGGGEHPPDGEEKIDVPEKAKE